jgi:hypothetical protein
MMRTVGESDEHEDEAKPHQHTQHQHKTSYTNVQNVSNSGRVRGDEVLEVFFSRDVSKNTSSVRLATMDRSEFRLYWGSRYSKISTICTVYSTVRLQ